ncbi:MAG TPA: hypothetical protein VGL42_11940 [Opitutaceae bacterium]|jgi:hypothetical protein
MKCALLSTTPDYTRNAEVLAEFYRLQGDLALSLALRPGTVRLWLGRQRTPRRNASKRGADTARWRTARLSGSRQQELRRLLDADSPELPGWLLASLPACTLLDIDDVDTPGAPGLVARELLRLRDQLLRANLGLAKTAAARAPGRLHEYDDRLSAACSGLLDAIDRYVPGPRSARFSYFAAYWIRYHVVRFNQKHSSVVGYPINRQRSGEGSRPIVVGMLDDLDVGAAVLNEAAPDPWEDAEEDELIGRVRDWLRRSVSPATRVMLAAKHAVGPLPEAAGDYLDHLREIARERLRDATESAACRPCPPTPMSLPRANESVRMCG